MIYNLMRLAIFLAVALLFAAAEHATGGEQKVQPPPPACPPIPHTAESEPKPTTLADCLSVPAEYSANFGGFRSPLIFNDMTVVQSANDWPRRRQEILTSWTKIMGPWPQVITHPSIEILSTQQRGKCLQQRIKIQVSVNEWTEGWLVSPPGDVPALVASCVYGR